MNNSEMQEVNGGFLGICLSSCPRGSRRGKSCCDSDGGYDDGDDFGDDLIC